jgi:hypothetical protein
MIVCSYESVFFVTRDSERKTDNKESLGIGKTLLGNGRGLETVRSSKVEREMIPLAIATPRTELQFRGASGDVGKAGRCRGRAHSL